MHVPRPQVTAAALPGSSLLGRNIDLQDAFGDDFQLQEEEEEIEVMPDEESQPGVVADGDATVHTHMQNPEPTLIADSNVIVATPSDHKDPPCGGGAGGVMTVSAGDAADSAPMSRSEAMAPRIVSMLRPPAQSMAKSWGLSMLNMPVTAVLGQEKVEIDHGAAEVTSDEVEQDAEGGESTRVYVGPGLVIQVARDKDARSKQRSDLLHLYNECLLTKQQYQDALESLRVIGARLDGDCAGTSLPDSADAPAPDTQDRKLSVGGRASRAASPRLSHRKSERGLSPAPMGGGASRASSPAFTGSRKSTGARAASPGPAASPRASTGDAASARKARLSNTKVPSTSLSREQARKSTSRLSGRPSAGSISSAAATGEDARGRQGRRSAGAGSLTPRSTGERLSPARRSGVSEKVPVSATGKTGACPAIRSSAAASLRTAGGMRSIGASGTAGEGAGMSTSKTPMRAPLRATPAPAAVPQ